MMQKKMIGQVPVLEKEALEEGRSAEEIREIIRTIEGFLEQTMESLERIEKFMSEVTGQNKKIAAERSSREKEEAEKVEERTAENPKVSPFI